MANRGLLANPTGAGYDMRSPAKQILSSGGSPLRITGGGAVGDVLTAAFLTGWSATNYQWVRVTNGTSVDISGATSSTYTRTTADGSSAGVAVSVTCRASGLSYFGSPIGGALLAADMLVVQQFIASVNPTAIRIRMSEQTRNYVIVRNLDSTFIGQIGFQPLNNNFVTQPGSFTDINPGEEWYETGSSNQIFVRPKTNGQRIAFQLEVSLPF